MAFDAICSAVLAEMIMMLATKDSALEAWESIKTMWIGDDHIRKAIAQKVQTEYEVLDFHNKEGNENFAMRLTGMVNQLAVLGGSGARRQGRPQIPLHRASKVQAISNFY
jgi:hypothetical protein